MEGTLLVVSCCHPFLCEDIEGLGDWVAKQGTQPGHHRRPLPLLPDKQKLLRALWLSAK